MIKGSSSEFSLQSTDGRRQEVLATERNDEILLRKSKRCCKIVGIGASNRPWVVNVLSNLYLSRLKGIGAKFNKYTYNCIEAVARAREGCIVRPEPLDEVKSETKIALIAGLKERSVSLTQSNHLWGLRIRDRDHVWS